MSPLVLAIQVIGDHRCTPHLAVRMTLHGNSRRVMVRLLKAPKNFAAVLPHGPANRATDEPFYREVDNPGAGINELGIMMYDSLERNLAEVAGLDSKQAEAHAGRKFGPRFVCKDLCGTPTDVRCRSTDVSRAWGLLATWLKQLGILMSSCRKNTSFEMLASRTTSLTRAAKESTKVVRDKLREADVLRWRILHYQHKFRFEHVLANVAAMAPNNAALMKDNAEELRQSKCFKIWRATITIQSLRSEFWVLALATVAEHESTTAARRAEAASRERYKTWLKSGPAMGLGRQHRMSRTAVGWVPTKVDSSKLLVVDDLDDTDGLSA